MSFSQLMKPFRLLLLVVGALAVLLLLAVALAFNSSVQTWAARKALAALPEWHGTIGSVDAGLGRVIVKAVRFEQDGAILTLPVAEVDLPVMSAAFSHRVSVTRLVATGWTLDLSKIGGAGTATAAAGSSPKQIAAADVPAATAAATGATLQAFSGVFSRLRLPVDVSLDGVRLEGDVVLPEGRGRVKIALAGGGLGAGREGTFDIAGDATLADPNVSALSVRGTWVAAMDTPRTFTQLALKLDAAASGAQFPAGVKLTAGVTAARAATGETYSAAITTEGRQLVALKADFPRDATRLEGTWRLNLRDADVAPFALGQPLPALTAVGEGKFDTDASFAALHATGRLSATAGRLEAVQPQLAAVGVVKLTADFDLARRGPVVAVQQLEAAFTSTQPVATVRALQSFEFDAGTREVRVADPARELVSVALQGLPLAWAKPFLKGIDVSGGDLRGDLVVLARGGGMTVRSRTPIAADRLTIAQAGKPLAREVDVSLNALADYTPQGWQAQVSGLTARSGTTQLFTFEAKAGRLAAAGQPLKATGTIQANLVPLLRQPFAAGAVALQAGVATIDFAGSLNEKQELLAKVSLRGMATTVEGKETKLPDVTADIRADVGGDGQLAVNAPILLERADRKSDLMLVGTIGAEKDKSRAVEGRLTSSLLVVDDAKILAAILPAGPKAPTGEKPRDASPFWAGLHGGLGLQLKKVVYTDAFEMTNVAGRIRLDAGALKLETVRAGVGEGGRAALDGTVTFDPAAAQPYQLLADVSLREFDPGPLFRGSNGSHAATVEGKFEVASKVTSRGKSLADLAVGAGGEFQVTSKGGVFRGLPVNAANLADNTNKLAGLIASAGTALGALTGRKEYLDVANKAQAVGELAKALSAIPYDQLSVVLARDSALNTTLHDFTLISPELRLTGSGTAKHRPGLAVVDDELAMEFTLRARGRQGDLLKYLGALEPQTDDLGYAACTLPLKVGGTLGRPDTTELNGKLASLALEKTGVGDKASELLNRIRGGNGAGK